MSIRNSLQRFLDARRDLALATYDLGKDVVDTVIDPIVKYGPYMMSAALRRRGDHNTARAIENLVDLGRDPDSVGADTEIVLPVDTEIVRVTVVVPPTREIVDVLVRPKVRGRIFGVQTEVAPLNVHVCSVLPSFPPGSVDRIAPNCSFDFAYFNADTIYTTFDGGIADPDYPVTFKLQSIHDEDGDPVQVSTMFFVSAKYLDALRFHAEHKIVPTVQ